MSHIKQIGIEMLQRQLGFDAALAPDAEGVHQRLQLATRFGQMIFRYAGLR